MRAALGFEGAPQPNPGGGIGRAGSCELSAQRLGGLRLAAAQVFQGAPIGRFVARGNASLGVIGQVRQGLFERLDRPPLRRECNRLGQQANRVEMIAHHGAQLAGASERARPAGGVGKGLIDQARGFLLPPLSDVDPRQLQHVPVLRVQPQRRLQRGFRLREPAQVEQLSAHDRMQMGQVGIGGRRFGRDREHIRGPMGAPLVQQS